MQQLQLNFEMQLILCIHNGLLRTIPVITVLYHMFVVNILLKIRSKFKYFKIFGIKLS